VLKDTYSKHYPPSEHVAVDKVIILFKERIIFKQYTPKKHKCFGIKIYKLHHMSGNTYDRDIYSCDCRHDSNQSNCKTIDKKWKDMDICYIWKILRTDLLVEIGNLSNLYTLAEGEAKFPVDNK
jgi:hypothetical protein